MMRIVILLLLLNITIGFSQEQDSLQIKLSKHDKEEFIWFRLGKLRSEFDKEILKNTKIQDTIRLNYEFKVDSIGRIHIKNTKFKSIILKSKIEKITSKEYKVAPFFTKGINKSVTSDKYNLYLLDENGNYKTFFPEFRTATFVGCQGNSKELKRCMNLNINKHISKNFNAGLANDLGLSSGKKRIIVRFEIDKEGKVQNVKAKAPHPRLRVEGERIIKLLPTLKPGVYDGKKIKIPYSIPIVFVVEDASPIKTKKQLRAEKKRLRKLK